MKKLRKKGRTDAGTARFAVALAGNPNCGKTTLFNALTGQSSRTGNWPGVTVERKSGVILPALLTDAATAGAMDLQVNAGIDPYASTNASDSTAAAKSGTQKPSPLPEIELIDLPGVYSLTALSRDEIIACDFLKSGGADLVLNVVDSTNLVRNLYLTRQLLKFDVPTVVALNMTDELRVKRRRIDAEALGRELGCPCVCITAADGGTLAPLLTLITDAAGAARAGSLPYTLARAQRSNLQGRADMESAPTVRSSAGRKTGRADDKNTTAVSATPDFDAVARGAAVVYAQNMRAADACTVDTQAKKTKKLTNLAAYCAEIAGGVLSARPHKINDNPQSAFSTDTYGNAAGSCTACSQTSNSGAPVRRLPFLRRFRVNKSDLLDRILTNKYLAFPIFALIMLAVFYMSVGGLGALISNLLQRALEPLLLILDGALAAAPRPLASFLTGGVLLGVFSVVQFVPQVMILFGMLAILEDCGYMSRAAFITDGLLCKIGLGGKSFISLVTGCGCSVPAIVGARVIESERERNATVTLCSFMPCSAKLAVISYFSATMFGGNFLVVFMMYFLGLAAVAAGGLLLKAFGKGDDGGVFFIELPPYRMPKAKNVLRQMGRHGKAFLAKAVTVILLATAALWLLTNFGFDLRMCAPENSMLAKFCRTITPVFIPLGFGQWEFVAAAFAGIAAKEAVVATLNVLLGGTNIAGEISGAGALAFLTFNLLNVPCVAAVSASFKEQGTKKAAFAMAFQFFMAYAFALVVFGVASFLGL